MQRGFFTNYPSKATLAARDPPHLDGPYRVIVKFYIYGVGCIKEFVADGLSVFVVEDQCIALFGGRHTHGPRGLSAAEAVFR